MSRTSRRHASTRSRRRRHAGHDARLGQIAPALGEPGASLSRAAANDDRITAVQDVSPQSTDLPSPEAGTTIPTLRASSAHLAGNAGGCLAQWLTFT